MNKTIRKVFWLWDFDKEEAWLNEMSAQGLQLQKVGFCRYTFQQGIPGEYTYRLEMLDNLPSHRSSIDYIQFIESTGAEHIGTLFRWVYFRKKTELGGFELFSDLTSRIQHLNRILILSAILSILNVSNGFNQIALWHAIQHSFNLAIGGLCLGVGLLIGWGSLLILQKKKKLQREQALYE